MKPISVVARQQPGHALPAKKPVETMAFCIKQCSPGDKDNTCTKDSKDDNT